MNEEEIRPKVIFDEYLRLAQRDAKTYFDESSMYSVDCPACLANGVYSFKKNGFAYEECPVCHTLFVSPRPPANSITCYYRDSESAKYWATTFYTVTAEARREKIWRPKAKMIHEFIERYSTNQYSLVDIGGGYGIFAEECVKLFGSKVTVIEPNSGLARNCREKGINVIEEFLEDIKPEQLSTGAKVFVSFELFEHLHSPENFLRHLKELMSIGDIFAFTTLSGTGVDIQALWKDSKSVFPPHHLNFLNPKSVRILLERVGFETLQISTPGKLDIDILCNNKQYIKDRFWRTFVIHASEAEKHAMQELLSVSGWSSHMLVVCQKLSEVSK